MSIKAVIFDLDGTITEHYFDFDAIRGGNRSRQGFRAFARNYAKDDRAAKAASGENPCIFTSRRQSKHRN